MIEKIGHYSLENPASIYDEEAMTALELAGRTASKVNECIDQVNKNTEDLPGMVAEDVQSHIDNGDFDKQIDEYAGKLEEDILAVDAKQSANLTMEVNKLDKRIDNIVANPGDGTTPTEVVDARQDFTGFNHTTLKGSIDEQVRLSHNHNGTLMYLGGGDCVRMENGDDGSVNITIRGRLSYYGRYGTSGGVDWETSTLNIRENLTVNQYNADNKEWSVTINLPKYKVLVYNRVSAQYKIVSTPSVDSCDVVLCANSYHNPYRGLLVEEWMYRNILENRKNAYTVRGAYLYGGLNFKMEFHNDEATPALDVTMYGRPTVCYGSTDAYMANFEGDDIEYIKDNVSHPTNHPHFATIKIPAWNALVWNHRERRWRFRWRANLQDGDILALATGYCQPLCGTLLEEWSAKKNQEFEKYLGAESMGYNPPAGVTNFYRLINGIENAEKFLWFTDPHLCEGGGWQTEFDSYKKQLKACFEATPATFAVCGGDWIGNSDTVEGACFKLGFIGGQMRSAFQGKYYPVVGNHDTNYQGILAEGADANTGKLDNATISNLWNKPGYYTFDGDNTRFFVFDSEVDWDLTLSQYKTEQIMWFAQELKNNPAENMAGFIHIYYNNNIVGEMGNKITEIANAYNNRARITFNGATFDYSGATGKFRFILAGHNHGDYIGNENGIPVILTTDTRENGEPTFDLCLVDYDADKLHLCRVGAGESRTVDI